MAKYQIVMINVITFLFILYVCQNFIATFPFFYSYETVIFKILCIVRSSSSVITFYKKSSDQCTINMHEKQVENKENI